MRESPQSTRSSRSPLPITGTRCWPSPHRRASTTGPCSGTGWSTSIGSRRPIPTGARAGVRMPAAQCAAGRCWNRRSRGSARAGWRRSSPSRWVAPLPADPRPAPNTSGGGRGSSAPSQGPSFPARAPGGPGGGGHGGRAGLAALRELPHVGDVRGRGLLAGIEFVEDKATRAPLPRTARFAESFTEAAQQTGLVVWPNVGHADGTNGDLVMVAPPFIVTEQEIDEIVRRFAEALEMTLHSRTVIEV